MQITIDYVYTGIYHVSTVCTITVKVYTHAYKSFWSFSASEPRGFTHLYLKMSLFTQCYNYNSHMFKVKRVHKLHCAAVQYQLLSLE